MVSLAKGRNLGIGKYMAERLKKGDTTEQVLAKTKKKFPISRATANDVSIIRRRVKRGEL